MAVVKAQGNARVAKSFLSYTATSSSEAIGFPASNIAILSRPKRVWRSTATGDQSIVLDFGIAVSPPAVFIDNANFETVVIQGNTTDVWTSPAFGSGSITLERDPRLGRRKRLIELATFDYRYMRIYIPSQTPDGGAGYYQIGALAVPEALTEMIENPSYPGRWTKRTPVQVNEFLSGGVERVKVGSLDEVRLGLTLSVESSDGAIQQIYNLFGDPTSLILFDWNFNVTYESYLCMAETDLDASRTGWNPYDFGEIELRVVV
ncbi:MAG: hypothetical protein QXX77_09810 [Candidatus Methanosuratincola sp.]